MTALQQQARALGDPTRHEIFRYLTDAPDAVGVAELTAHLGLNHNAVRQHLAKLVDAGLVVESTAPPTGRGRPRLEYRVDPRMAGRWGATGPYERLSVLLAELVRSGDAPVEVGRRAVRQQPLRPLPGGALDALVDEMARHGFDPEVRRDGGSIEVILRSCPFVSAVLTDPGTVCDLHLGLAQGVADEVGGLVVDALVPHDPRRAHCVLRCHESTPGETPGV